jgi:hypothetical protein
MPCNDLLLQDGITTQLFCLFLFEHSKKQSNKIKVKMYMGYDNSLIYFNRNLRDIPIKPRDMQLERFDKCTQL